MYYETKTYSHISRLKKAPEDLDVDQSSMLDLNCSNLSLKWLSLYLSVVKDQSSCQSFESFT